MTKKAADSKSGGSFACQVCTEKTTGRTMPCEAGLYVAMGKEIGGCRCECTTLSKARECVGFWKNLDKGESDRSAYEIWKDGVLIE